MNRNVQGPFERGVRITGATVEEVSSGRGGNYIIVSHGLPGPAAGLTMIELLRLNITRDTVIRSRNGRRANLRDIRAGMKINALHSSRMTASIPPQAEAYEITLLTEAPAVNVKTDRIVEVNPQNAFIITGNPRRPQEQIRFNISPSTSIFDRSGRRIRLCELRVGQRVRVEHAAFMTRSIPPQTTAYVIRVVDC